jgi:hypothetical protein
MWGQPPPAVAAQIISLTSFFRRVLIFVKALAL